MLLLIINQFEMKKVLFMLLFIASNHIIAQNIAFEQVAIKVEAGKGQYVLDLLDSFYGNIDKPEGVNISLDRVYFKSEDIEATHYLGFSGPLEGLAELRKIRNGDKYLLFNSNILEFGNIVSVVGGNSIMRMNVSERGEAVAQIWKWRVDDPASFINEFTNLIKGFPQEGYLSLGQFSHGIGSDGENMYVYMTHDDYEAALGWGPKTPQQQEAFAKFGKNTSKYSDFHGTVTMVNLKNW